jgi:hypothetical protein
LEALPGSPAAIEKEVTDLLISESRIASNVSVKQDQNIPFF